MAYYAWVSRAQALTMSVALAACGGPTRTWSGHAMGDELTAAIDVVLDCADGRLRAERSLRVLMRRRS